MSNGQQSDLLGSHSREPEVDIWVSEEEPPPDLLGEVGEPPTEHAPAEAASNGASREVAAPPVLDTGSLVDVRALPDLPRIEPDAPATGFPAPSPDDFARWQLVVADLEREAKAIGDEPRAAALHVEIGRIWEEQLGKPRNAAMAYQRAFQLDARDPSVLHASRRLFTEVGNWGMVVQILQAEIDGTERPDRKASLLSEKGAILEEKLRSVEDAQKAYREALDVWSAEPLAIDALERLHLMRQEYAELYGVYRRALEVATRAQRRLPLLLAAAQLVEDRLEDNEAAIALYGEILDIDQHNVIALAALRRLTQQAARWDEFVRVMTLSAEATQDPADAAQLLLAAAKAQHERLHLTDRALLLLLKALEHAPEDLGVLHEIEWLYEQNERYDEVVKVLRREAEVTTEPRDRVPILFKLGTVLEEHVRLTDEAIPVFEEAVVLMPSYVPAKQALGRLYEKTQRWEQLAQLFEMEVRLEEDVAVKITKLFKLADILDNRLDRADEAVRVLSDLLALKPDYVPARKHLERLYQKSESWSALIDLYEQEIGHIEDRVQRVFLLDRIGLLAEEKLGDLERATGAYRRILELVPGHLHAIRTIARLATKQGLFSEVMRMHELEVEATEDPKEIVVILHRAGMLAEEKLGDVPGALLLYEKALALSPTYLPALGSLGRLYHQLGRWEDLAGMYRREIEVSKSNEQRISLLFRMADVLVEHLRDDRRAATAYEEILEFDRENLAALRALAEIHSRNGENEKLVEVLLREAGTLKEPRERASTLYRVAGICEEKLGRSDRAAELYQDALRFGYNHDAAIRALVRIYSSEGMWNALSRALRTALDHATLDVTRAAILVRCAEVSGDKLGNLEAASEYLEEALRVQPGDVAILTQVERVAVARRDWRRAITVGETLAAMETDSRLFAARQIRLATVKETQLDPPESGAEHYRLALSRVPDHPVALRALEIAYRRSGHWTGLSAFYQREALVTRDLVRKTNLYCRAADVLEHRLEKLPEAADMYLAALEVTPTHLPALHGRRRLAEKMGDNAVALECVQREGQLTSDPDHARELLFEAGQIYENRFKDVAKATETYRAVLERLPSHVGAFARLEGIYLEQKAWRPLLELFTRRAEAVDNVEEKTKLYLAAGKVAQDMLAEPLLAIDLFGQVLARERMNPSALVRLGPLLFHQGNWDAAIDVFHRTLAVSREPPVLLIAFKSLGIIYQEHRQDLVKCVQSFQAAIAASPEDTECLRRLASVYQGAKDWASAINVLLRLAECEQDRERRVKTLLELAQIYEQAADRPNAILANRKALEFDPTNTSATLRLIELYEREQDWNSVAEMTGTYVRLLPSDKREQAVPHHLKMADIFETKLADDNRAINALRFALDADMENTRALERLAYLYAKTPDTYPHSVEMHRRLLKQDPFRLASYRAMHEMFLKRNELDKAFVVSEILVFLRGQQQEEELFYHEHKDKVAPIAAGVLSAEDHERLISHPNERGIIRGMMEVLGVELPKAAAADLTKYDLKREDRHGPKSDLPLRKLADELCRVLGPGPLGLPPFELAVTKKLEVGFWLESALPPAVIVGFNTHRRVQEKEQRFQLARVLERVKGGHHLIDLFPNRELEALVFSVVKLADPNAHVPTDPASLEAMQRRVLRALSGRGKKVIEEMRPALAQLRFDVAKYRAAAHITALRAALVLTNDIEVAVRSLAKDHPDVRPVFADAKGAAATIGRIPEVRELLGYAVSEEYFSARVRLGFSIQS